MALTASLSLDIANFERGCQQAVAAMNLVPRASKTVNRDLTRLMESFSGQKIAVEAARMAEAVQRVGGASKLTEAEQRRVNATLTEALAKYKALGQEAPKALTDLHAATSKTAQSATGLVGALKSAPAQLAAVGAAVAAVTATATAFWNTIERGGKVSAMRQSFEALSGGSEQARARIDAIRKSTGGLVTDMEAMQAANKAMLLDLGLTDAQMGDLAATATVLGRAMGQDAGKSLDDLITALGRSSPMILDNLGLSVKLGEAHEAYARSLGRTADELTDAEKKQAFMNAAMDAASKKVEQLGGLQLNAADHGHQLWTQIKNLADASASWVSNLGPVNWALEGVSNRMQVMEALLRGGMKDALDTYRRQVEGDIPKAHGAAADALAASQKRLGASMGPMTMGAAEMDRISKQLTDTVTDNIKAFDKFNGELSQFGGGDALARGHELVRILGALGGPAKVLPSQLEAMSKQLAAAAEAARTIGNQALAKEFDALARTLSPVVQFQQKYNVTIGEYVPMGMDAADVTGLVAEQMAVLTGEVVKIGPGLGKLNSQWVAYREAVAAVTPRQIAQAGASEQQAAASRKLADVFRDLAGALADLAQTNGGRLGAVAQTVASMAVGATAGAQMASAMGEIAASGAAAVGSYVKLASAAVAAAAAMAQATGSADRTKNILAGAGTGAMTGGMAGAQIGTMVQPGMGTLVGGIIGAVGGALIGGIIGSLRKRDMQDALHRVGRDWGVAISEGMAEGIAADAKNLFNGNKQAAEIFNMSDIIGEAGGLNGDNFARMVGKLRDVMVMFATGTFTAAQAAKVLDDNFRAFVEAGTDASGRLSPSLQEIIRLTKELGLASKEVTAYLKGQAAAAITGFNAVSAGSARWRELGQAVTEAQKRVDELNQVEARGRGADWTAEMTKAQQALTDALTKQHAASQGVGTSLADLGTQALAVFNAAIASGMSYGDALRQIQPGIQSLIASYKDLGLPIDDAAIKVLAMQSEMLKNNPEILSGIDGLTQSFVALSNMGMLNADTFAAMQRTAMDLFGRIQAEVEKSGLTGDDAARAALLPMQAYLHQAAKQAELLGMPLDEATQKLIDQSKAAGVWKDDVQDPMEQVRDAVIEMKDAILDMVAAFGQVPRNVDTEVTTRYRSEGSAPSGGSIVDPNDPRLTGGTRPSFAPGAGSTPTAGATTGSGTPSVTHTHLYIDGREVAVAVAPYMPEAERSWGV